MTQESVAVAHDVEELLATAPAGETPDLSGAYPRLGEERIRMLSCYGSRRPTSRGELLIVEGRPDEAFIVVLSGRVAIVKAFGTPEQQIVRVHGPGRFLGELGLLTGQVAFFTAIVLDPGEVLEVSTDRLRECLMRDPAFGDEILRAYLTRRTGVADAEAAVERHTASWSPDAYAAALERFLALGGADLEARARATCRRSPWAATSTPSRPAASSTARSACWPRWRRCVRWSRPVTRPMRRSR